MCNFGHLPFVFDLKAYQSKLVGAQYNEVKSKRVELDAIYSLVQNYLSVMGYTETLEAFDENQQNKELHKKDEPGENIEFDSPLERKMTIDQADNSDKREEKSLKAESAKKSHASKSQLSHETE